MANKWYFARDSKTYGPYSAGQLRGPGSWTADFIQERYCGNPPKSQTIPGIRLAMTAKSLFSEWP